MSNDRYRDLLSIPDVARQLSISPHTVRSWIGQRRLGYFRIGRAILSIGRKSGGCSMKAALPHTSQADQCDYRKESRRNRRINRWGWTIRLIPYQHSDQPLHKTHSHG
jgi:transposase-like protein